ncbi:hypothetical protein AB0K60_17985 [Thermopolyspora sp. NPDC052614]|uniref:hypothetical protein n=1 Tax=Thermopolyspora sp. NPDC052614 TaxID=3155682 RepID=UPI0034275E04
MRVEGSRFEFAEQYTIKLEGARVAGYETPDRGEDGAVDVAAGVVGDQAAQGRCPGGVLGQEEGADGGGVVDGEAVAGVLGAPRCPPARDDALRPPDLPRRS